MMITDRFPGKDANGVIAGPGQVNYLLIQLRNIKMWMRPASDIPWSLTAAIIATGRGAASPSPQTDTILTAASRAALGN
jgi:hypothetical protein